MKPQPRASGMTLLEVLMALFVLALALGAGFKASAALWQQTQRSEQQWLAQLCADNHWAALRLAARAPALGSSQTVCDQLGQRLAVHTQVVGTPNPSFRKVEVVVRLPEGGAVLLHSTALLARF